MVVSKGLDCQACFQPNANPGNELYGNVAIIREATLPINYLRSAVIPTSTGKLDALRISVPKSSDGKLMWAKFFLIGDIVEWTDSPTHDMECQHVLVPKRPLHGDHVVMEQYYYAWRDPSTGNAPKTTSIIHTMQALRTGQIEAPNPVPPVRDILIVDATQCAQNDVSDVSRGLAV